MAERNEVVSSALLTIRVVRYVRHAVSSREWFLALPKTEVAPSLYDEKDIHEEELCTVRIKRNTITLCE